MRCRKIFWGVLWTRAAGCALWTRAVGDKQGLSSKKTAWGLLGGVPSSRGLVVPAVGAEVGEKFFKA